MVDGNLSEWSPSEFVPMDNVYDASYQGTSVAELESDVPLGGASYAARWGPNNKLYVAVQVYDTDHYFTDDYVDWYTRDAIEVYVHTTGTGPVDYEPNQNAAQQYEIGIKNSNQSQVWSSIGYGNSASNPVVPIPGPNNPIPANAGFQAVGETSGTYWLYYEVAVDPSQYFSLDGNGLIPSPLSAGQLVGLDVCVVAAGGQGYNGMWSVDGNDTTSQKSSNYLNIDTHLLVADCTVGNVKTSSDNAGVSCTGVVSAVFAGSFYVESTDRTFGICVEGANSGVAVGQLVSVSGTVQTLASGERYIFDLEPVAISTPGSISPLGMTNKSLGGGNYGTVSGRMQPGVTGATGLNNIGLLVKTTGKVGQVNASAGWFMIDDGSGVGVKVFGSVPSGKSYVTVTGISSCENDSGAINRTVISTAID